MAFAWSQVIIGLAGIVQRLGGVRSTARPGWPLQRAAAARPAARRTAAGVVGGVKPSDLPLVDRGGGVAAVPADAPGAAVAEPLAVAVGERGRRADGPRSTGVLPAACGTTRPRGRGDVLALALAVAVALAVPVAFAVAEAEPVAPADGVALPDGVAGAARAPAAISSGRKFSSAVVADVLERVDTLAGDRHDDPVEPWVTTSAEDTPRPLTRSVMIWRAWSMADLLGVLPWWSAP